MKRRLRVGVDGILIRRQGKGVSRFLVSFLHTFAACNTTDIGLVVFLNQDAELPVLPEIDSIRYVPVRVAKQLVWDLWGFHQCIKNAEVDLVFTLSDRTRVGNPFLTYLFEIPDYRISMNHIKAGAYQRLSDRMTEWVFPQSVKNAARIATSSIATKNDLICKYGVPEHKLWVIYPAPDPIFRPCTDGRKIEAIRSRHDAREGYLLHFSSNNDPRDNTGAVLQAFALSLKRNKHGKKLLIAGVQRLESFGWGELLKELRLDEKVIFAGFMTGTELTNLYQAADAYVDPSLYEGFGFQVAEAMACGVPVICSNVTSLPEVAGDAAILIEPTDVEGLIDAIISVIRNPALGVEMARKGLRQVQKFCWERTTEELLALIKEAAGV